MARKGSNKKRCERYKLSGHREINKKLKAERAEARKAHFAKRKENGKAYTYKKGSAEEKLRVAAESGAALPYNAYLGQWISNWKSNQARHTEVSRFKSAMRKVQNVVNKLEMEEKLAAAEAKKMKRKGTK